MHHPSSMACFPVLLRLLLVPLLLALIISLCSASSYYEDDGGKYPEVNQRNGEQHDQSSSIPPSSYLSPNYYHQSCPQLEAIIHTKVNHWIQKDYTLAASLLRLHYHDCAVRGCDASILLTHEGSERTANISKTLRGFEVIDDIKAGVEAKCPKTVSCADILTAAARDATVRIGGPYWMVPYGRKDGLVSVAQEAEAMLPKGHSSVTELIEFYQSKGLNILDLAVLSGAHSIGRASCEAIQWRLYNFNGTGKADPSLNPKYLIYLRRKCRWASEYVDLDGTTPFKFDAVHFKNLDNGMALLKTDQILHQDSRTGPLIAALASQPDLFYHQFTASMTKLGNVHVLSGDEGQIRVNCNLVNHLSS